MNFVRAERLFKIALFQSTSGVDPADNAAALVHAIGVCGAAGVDMLFTPEMVGCLDRDRARSAGTVRSERDDVVLSAVREAAARFAIWVHVGSLGIVSDRDDTKRANRSFVIDDKGQIKARYDKVHLFDVDLPSGENWRESAVYQAGTQAVVVDTPWARLGLSICYDLRFADLYRKLSDAGAEILLVPAAFTVPTGEAHWHVLLRARAIESACYVIASAQTGHHDDGRDTFGHTLVVDPWGEVLLDMGTQPGLAMIDIDLSRIVDVRSRIPVLSHRRDLPENVQKS